MLRRALPPLLLCLLLPFGCDKRAEKPDAATPAVDAPRSETPPLRIADAVPASAIAVAIVQTHEPWIDALVAVDPLGPPEAAEVAALRQTLNDFLARETGVALADVTTATVFLLPDGNKDVAFAVLLEGVPPSFTTPTADTHRGVDMHAVSESELVAAKLGSHVALGDTLAVRAAIDAHGGHEPRFAEASPLGPKLLEMGRTASAGAALDLPALRKWAGLNALAELDRAFVSVGSQGLRTVVEGDPEAIEDWAAKLEQGLTLAVSQAEKLEAQKTRGGDVTEGALAIVAHYYARRLAKQLDPKVDGGTMTIALPIRTGDPALLAALFGLGPAIAIPALTKYMRRSKTSEARVQIAKMFDSASAYFIEEQVRKDAESALGALHLCPNDGNSSGQSGITPPLTLNCNEGPGGRCVPSTGDTSARGFYSFDLWTENSVWQDLNFAQEQAHYFHYNFKYTNGTAGYGSCQFTAQAFADLDDDGIFSTYERAGAIDENGLNGAAGLYIDRELE